MAILLALASSLAFGTADFSGGLASRRVPAIRVAFVSQIVGLPVLLLGFLVIDGEITARAMAYGAAGGVSGGVGVVFLYRALGDGPMSVVAPVTSLLTGAVPIVVGVGLGERPSMTAWAGVALAIAAIFLVTRAPAATAMRASRATIVRSLVAGTAFGLAFVWFSRPGGVAGLWPLVAARAASLPVLAAMVVATGAGVRIGAGARRATATAGALDMAANVLVIEAFSRGLLTLVSVVTALYPATTLVLARFVLDERIRGEQALGLVAAAGAVVLVAL